jgi:hypothetical protein
LGSCRTPRPGGWDVGAGTRGRSGRSNIHHACTHKAAAPATLRDAPHATLPVIPCGVRASTGTSPVEDPDLAAHSKRLNGLAASRFINDVSPPPLLSEIDPTLDHRPAAVGRTSSPMCSFRASYATARTALFGALHSSSQVLKRRPSAAQCASTSRECSSSLWTLPFFRGMTHDRDGRVKHAPCVAAEGWPKAYPSRNMS